MISCRLAVLSDLPALLESDLFDEVPSEAGLSSFIGSAWDLLVLGFEDSELAGFCTVHCLPRPDRPREGFVYEIGVSEPYQRRGIARALLTYARAECMARGVEGLWVITNRSNKPACALYESTGAFSAADDEVVYEWP